MPPTTPTTTPPSTPTTAPALVPALVPAMVPALVLALAAALTGCSTDPESPGAPGAAQLPAHVVVFAPDDVGAFGPEADWTPQADDVTAAEPLLKAELERRLPQVTLDYTEDYVRQYAGVDGDALVVNAACDPGDHWREDWIVVDDGGPCFWHARVEEGRVSAFVANGVA